MVLLIGRSLYWGRLFLQLTFWALQMVVIVGWSHYCGGFKVGFYYYRHKLTELLCLTMTVRTKLQCMFNFHFTVKFIFSAVIAKRRKLFSKVKTARDDGKSLWIAYGTLNVDGRLERESRGIRWRWVVLEYGGFYEW